MNRTFTEISEFRESDKSLKHELGSMSLTYVLLELWWHPGWVAGLSPFTVIPNTFFTEFREFSETFGKNSNDSQH